MNGGQFCEFKLSINFFPCDITEWLNFLNGLNGLGMEASLNGQNGLNGLGPESAQEQSAPFKLFQLKNVPIKPQQKFVQERFGI